MLFKIIDGIFKGRKVVFDDIPYKISIDVKIPVGNVVAHTFHGFPRYFWSGREQLLVGALVNTFYPLANCFYQHTIRSERFHPVG